MWLTDVLPDDLYVLENSQHMHIFLDTYIQNTIKGFPPIVHTSLRLVMKGLLGGLRVDMFLP